MLNWINLIGMGKIYTWIVDMSSLMIDLQELRARVVTMAHSRVSSRRSPAHVIRIIYSNENYMYIYINIIYQIIVELTVPSQDNYTTVLLS